MKKELMLRKDGKKKQRLDQIKKRLNASIDNVRGFIESALTDLYIIQSEQLYYYDECRTMKDFLIKNGYTERLNLNALTIGIRIKVLRYCEENKFSEATKKVSWTKLSVMADHGITQEVKVKKLALLTVKQIRDQLEDPKSRRSYTTTPGASIKSKQDGLKEFLFQIPKGKEDEFETQLVGVCKRLGVKIL